MKALVLGSTGMLGVQVATQLAASGIDVTGTSRRASMLPGTLSFDAERDSIRELLDASERFDYIVNAIGIIKPYIKDGIAADEERALRVNSLFPHELARTAENLNAKVIQIATDCVYSGVTGNYLESEKHDALDVYGKTKSLGEVASPAMMHLRCSIIGREVGRSTSLVEWVLGQEKNVKISGYTNHRWNGVTTDVFGQLCAGIITESEFTPGMQHIVPANVVSKFQLVSEIARVGDRTDITVDPFEATDVIDRTLSTEQSARNSTLWAAAGFPEAPTVEAIVASLAR